MISFYLGLMLLKLLPSSSSWILCPKLKVLALWSSLGLEVARSLKGISICKHKYCLELIQRVGLLACKLAPIPMNHSTKLVWDNGSLFAYIAGYRWLIRQLLYLIATRPDICYAVATLSQFCPILCSPIAKLSLEFLGTLREPLAIGYFAHRILNSN